MQLHSPAQTGHDQESAASGKLAYILPVMLLHAATGSGIFACLLIQTTVIAGGPYVRMPYPATTDSSAPHTMYLWTVYPRNQPWMLS